MGAGLTAPSPYQRIKSWSHTSHACTASPAGVSASKACMKSWYELASLVKRCPFALTAIKPGLARSIRCGKCTTWPLACGTQETGARAAACTPSRATTAPTDSPMRKPSPVLPRLPADQCSKPDGACGKHCFLRSGSCGKPPVANTTPRRAVMLRSPDGVAMTAPVTRASDCSKRNAGAFK